MTDIEIPYENQRDWRYRFFEILPGALSWTLLLLPLILSLLSVTVAAIFIFMYILINFTRGVGGCLRALGGYREMRRQAKLDWNAMCTEVETGQAMSTHHHPKWHYNNLTRLQSRPSPIKPSDVLHAIIIATYQESRAVLEPTIQAVMASDFDMKKVMLVLAYEERGGAAVEEQAKQLINDYKDRFRYAIAVKHPQNIPGEVIGKGGNITFAGRHLQRYIEEHGLDPLSVVVTTLDADNRPDKNYLAALTYLYCVTPDPERTSYQPLPMFTNNIWDAPAPMRVIASSNTFFYLILTQRPHLQRNFSSHAQSMKALIAMNFWSVRTIVEDGHQFWRSYFFYDGDYRVYPLAIPIYQDAVLADTYRKTLKAQFIQLRRWTYGASDIAYVANQGFLKKNAVRRGDLLAKFLRLLEAHVTWAAGSLLLAFAGFVPALLNPQSYVANELPLILSRIQTVGLVLILALPLISLKTLPPRPTRYRPHRSVFMLLQWPYALLTAVLYGSLPALYSQTRLMFKRYLTKFDVTEKAVVTGDKEPVT